MPCYAPLDGWRSRKRTTLGKRSIVFDARDGYSDLRVTVPCGRCIGCRLEYSRQWAMRCMHEASLHDENCFLTLTYSPESLPKNGSLDKRDFQLFMKRLRGRSGKPIRFYHCGEYGEETLRPHYHALLFGFDFADKVLVSERKGYPIFRSNFLEETWRLGLTEIGSVSFESAAYCTRYLVKSQAVGKTREQRDAWYKDRCLEPEYVTMSRRPGIGAAWWSKYKEEVMGNDSVIVGGREVKPARYYDGQFRQSNPKAFASVRRARERASRSEEETGSRLEVRAKVAEAKFNFFKRGEL